MLDSSSEAESPRYDFSSDLKPLINELAVVPENLPLDTGRFLERHGRDKATSLVKELVEKNATGGLFFADACSLVRLDWLPEETQKWFKSKGIKVIEDENIVVHLRHNIDDRFAGSTGCHEISQLLIYGSPNGQLIDDREDPTHVAKNSFTPHDMDENFPRGAWADVNAWERMRLTVTAGFVTGTGPNARGILVPSGEDVFYWSTPNSWAHMGDKRNFYIKQGETRPSSYYGLPDAYYGLRALAKYLKGEIPAK